MATNAYNNGTVVLLVDDDLSLCEMVREWFEENGYAVEIAGDVDTAVEIAHKHSGKTVLAYVDINLPGKSGIQFFTYVSEYLPHVAPCAWSGEDDESLRSEAEFAGALRFFKKPLNKFDILNFLPTAIRFVKRSVFDLLTGLWTRPIFMEFVGKQLKAERRTAARDTEDRRSRPLLVSSLVYIDINNFKDINDVYGHDAGDLALKTIAEVIRKHVRPSDHPCRFGGDELVIWFPDTDEKQVEMKIDELKLAVEHAQIVSDKGEFILLTISAGSVTMREDELAQFSDPLGVMLKRADADLYLDKERNPFRRK